MVLPDILQPNLNIVFCGTAAGKISAQRGAYYAHPGNKFYRILHETELTDQLLEPQEFRKLPQYGIGLTDMNKTQSGNDDELNQDHFDSDALRLKIQTHRPKILAFTSKRAAREFFGLKSSTPIEYGKQKEQIGNTAIYVLPSTSGAASASWDAAHWHAMAEEIAKTGQITR